jgi:Na+/melibiose symporter-like transporter
MKEVIIFLLVIIGIITAPLLIWYWAMKKERASLLLLISMFAFVTIGLSVFFWLSSDIGNFIILFGIGSTISQSVFLFVASKIVPDIFEKFGIKRKK